MFGVGRAKPRAKAVKKIEAIARKHGAIFVEADLPGTGYQHWFESADRGDPFNRTTRDAVYKDLASGGLLDEDGRITDSALPHRVQSRRKARG